MKGMTYAEGCAFGLIYPTSYAGLVFRADLKPGETLLVHAAAGLSLSLFLFFSPVFSSFLFFYFVKTILGGVGSAAVQIGRALGAKVIATVGMFIILLFFILFYLLKLIDLI